MLRSTTVVVVEILKFAFLNENMGFKVVLIVIHYKTHLIYQNLEGFFDIFNK